MPSSSSDKGGDRTKRSQPRSGPRHLRLYQVLVLVACFVLWHVLASPTLLPPLYFDDSYKAAFFFGEPLKVIERLGNWFVSGEIYPHLWVTLLETIMAFAIGTVFGVLIGLWLGLSPIASAICDPYIKAANAMPRVILGPIFFVWFGLGMGSQVGL